MIFWDTCALVDIIRIPHSTKNFTLATLQQYEKIAQWLEEGKIISITSDIVRTEFNEHYIDEHAKLLSEQNKRIIKIKDFTQYLPSAAKAQNINNSVDRLKVKKRLEQLTDRICKQTYIMRLESSYAKFDDYRIRKKLAPASSKGEFKDCYIWGTFLSVLKELNSTCDTYFVTTNPADYASGGRIFTQIETDCITSGGTLILHIGQLYSLLNNVINPLIIKMGLLLGPNY